MVNFEVILGQNYKKLTEVILEVIRNQAQGVAATLASVPEIPLDLNFNLDLPRTLPKKRFFFPENYLTELWQSLGTFKT